MKKKLLRQLHYGEKFKFDESDNLEYIVLGYFYFMRMYKVRRTNGSVILYYPGKREVYVE